MPPVHRHHHGRIPVPVELLDAVDNLFGLSEGCAEDYGLDPDEAADLTDLTELERGEASTIDVDAAALCAFRNTLDTYTLASDCEQYNTATATGCGYCPWCQSLLLRDWCDVTFDRNGYLATSPYLAPQPGYRPDDEYRHLMNTPT